MVLGGARVFETRAARRRLSYANKFRYSRYKLHMNSIENGSWITYEVYLKVNIN